MRKAVVSPWRAAAGHSRKYQPSWTKGVIQLAAASHVHKAAAPAEKGALQVYQLI